MRIKSLVRFIALLAVVALAIPAVAKPISKNINIAESAKLGTSELSAGEYRLLIDGAKVTVQRNSKVVAEAQGRWEDRDEKARYNAVLLGPNHEVKEIRFAGERRVFVIATP